MFCFRVPETKIPTPPVQIPYADLTARTARLNTRPDIPSPTRHCGYGLASWVIATHFRPRMHLAHVRHISRIYTSLRNAPRSGSLHTQSKNTLKFAPLRNIARRAKTICMGWFGARFPPAVRMAGNSSHRLRAGVCWVDILYLWR